MKYDEFNGCMYDISEDLIYIPLENNIEDVYNIIHEFMHYTNKEYELIPEYEFLSEVSSVFFEFLTMDYLNKYAASKESIYDPLNDKILKNYCTNKEVNKEELDFDLHDTCEILYYPIAYLLASKFYQEYIVTPDMAIKKIIYFNENFGYQDFNKTMKEININIRYVDDKLVYNDTYLKSLIKCYNEYVEIIQNKGIKEKTR